MEKCVKSAYEPKRVVQMCFFAVLPIIDVFRSSGNGWQMMLAAQAVGTVLAGILFIHYGIKSFIKWYNLLWIGFAGVAIATMPYWFYDEIIKYYYLYEAQLAIVNLALFGMILTRMLVEYVSKRSKIRFKKRGIVLLSAWFVYIFMATLMKDNTYRPEFDLLYFSIFYFAYFDKEELKRLTVDLSNGIIIGFSVLQCIAFFFRPYVDGIERYSGMYYNSNMFDLMCLLVLMICLIKMTNTRKIKSIKHWSYWGWLVYYAFVFSLLLLSVGRISILIAVIGTIIYTFFIVLDEKKSVKTVFGKIFLLFIAICIMLPITFSCVSYLPRILKHPITFQDEYLKWGNLNDDSNYVSFSEFSHLTLGRFSILYNDYSQKEYVEGDAKEEQENYSIDPDWEKKTYYLDWKGYNSVELRIAIWRTYLDEVNLWGHTVDEWGIWVTPNRFFVHAHNIFIMQAYVYGLIDGCIFLIWIISYLVTSWKSWRCDKYNSYSLFPLMTVLLLISFGMFELDWMSGQLSWMLVLFLQKGICNTSVGQTEM